MAAAGAGGVSRGGADNWRRLWETAIAGVAVLRERAVAAGVAPGGGSDVGSVLWRS